ncbi:acetyl/propionyl/methylcrotonyl-CoA carboxylase subunit alpha [Desertibaculum subflavum]|uniref:acetyl/propionyl/methylcrotonyl-CoA carboxylase subunit alpha n=1 Tax=Desertibaculum subflavum TaxID=2268458 RepID=UPI000E673695
MSFTNILIANRGEIACRIIRTARAMGYRMTAVFSDADADARHVALADQAARIGPPDVRSSYLNIDAILAAAKKAGADAVHPGYGFLSENEGFAAACEQAGLVFIGPPPAAIEAMGNKAAAKRRMIAAEVPTVPGYQGHDQSDARLAEEAERIGFPLMVKAAAGGGGRGMRVVGSMNEFARAVAGARSEAKNAFGSDELILERAVIGGRHVEIQVFADAHGNVIHLGERDCSAQRRHQKVIEEAPSPAVDPHLRARMGEAAVAAAKAIGYRGAGTVEFLLDANGHFYFLEMNTRLQVEHPVTEMVTGFDLVEWQLRVAAGEKLPISQEELTLTGHAIEARLYAEDPFRNFLPQSGDILVWAPVERDGVRTDHGLKPRATISPYYDPMIAKVIAHGRTREEARRRLIAALQDTVVLGIQTNRRFLVDLVSHPVFVEGGTTTTFIQEAFGPKSPLVKRPAPGTEALAIAAVLHQRRLGAAMPLDGGARGWRSTGITTQPLRLTIRDEHHVVDVTPHSPAAFEVAVGDARVRVDIIEIGDNRLTMEIDGLRRTVAYAFRDAELVFEADGVSLVVAETLMVPRSAAEGDGDAELRAPMNGKIVSVLAQPGDKVAKGQRLIVLEAMKIEHEIAAGRAGTLATVNVKPGDQVPTRHLLASLASEG